MQNKEESMEEYYIIKKNGKLIAIIEANQFLNAKNTGFLKGVGELEIQEVGHQDRAKLFQEPEILLVKDKDSREKLKEKLFVLEMVEKIKNQLMVEKDMDLILPEKAREFLPQIQQELTKEGIVLQHPLRECIYDIDPLSKFQVKLEREKANKERGWGRSRDDEA